MENDDGITWLDDAPMGHRPLSKRENQAARHAAKQERLKKKRISVELREANRQARLDAKPTPLQKHIATRARNEKLRLRAASQAIRERLRLERLLRLALRPARVARPSPKVPHGTRKLIDAEERRVRQCERDAAREAKMEVKRVAARLKRFGPPPLPY